jgi:hypothetical protein
MFAVKSVKRTFSRAGPTGAVFSAMLIVHAMRGKGAADRKVHRQYFGLLCGSGHAAI